MSSIGVFVVENSGIICALQREIANDITAPFYEIIKNRSSEIVDLFLIYCVKLFVHQIPECTFDFVFWRQSIRNRNSVELDNGFRLEDWNGKRSIK